MNQKKKNEELIKKATDSFKHQGKAKKNRISKGPKFEKKTLRNVNVSLPFLDRIFTVAEMRIEKEVKAVSWTISG